jgi:glycosyltransferase involved in cell wall biosynthesis
MISVIVPTMWKAPHLMKMLPLLENHSLIGEVIIIDNDTSKTNANIHNYSKVVHLPQKENIYVNPAWNLGVKVSRFDKLCFLNDDVVFNVNSIDTLYELITPERGLLGFSEASYCGFSPELYDTLVSSGIGSDVHIEETNIYENESTSGMPHVYYGCVMFLHKERFFVIPHEFKIYFGDLFVYLMNAFKINQGEEIAPNLRLVTKLHTPVRNYTIEDGLVITKMSSTVKSFNEQIDKEKAIFYDVFARHGIYKKQ